MDPIARARQSGGRCLCVLEIARRHRHHHHNDKMNVRLSSLVAVFYTLLPAHREGSKFSLKTIPSHLELIARIKSESVKASGDLGGCQMAIVDTRRR